MDAMRDTYERVRAEERAYAAAVRHLAEEIARRSGAEPDYEGVAARFKAWHQGSTWGWHRCVSTAWALLTEDGRIDWDVLSHLSRQLP